MVQKLNKAEDGSGTICEIDGKNSGMLMDISLLSMKNGACKTLFEEKKETAVLLLTGKITVRWEGRTVDAVRSSVFDEGPFCLHVPGGIKIEITAAGESELIVQRAGNDRTFESRFYAPEDCRSDIFGDGEWNDTARRVVRTVFDYGNAPYSNMVMGEVINFPGKWSSYPPHSHPQPEVYYYKFDRPNGFGLCLTGEEAYKITDNSYALIPGGLDHPQTTAPGYAMYYCWMIRHLESNPWTDRIVNKDHKWLLDSGIKIWPDK